VLATITYRMENLRHPFDPNANDKGVYVWALVKVITPAHGETTETPVALFNLDSEARTFQGHVYAEKLDGKLVTINDDIRELCKMNMKRRKR